MITAPTCRVKPPIREIITLSSTIGWAVPVYSSKAAIENVAIPITLLAQIKNFTIGESVLSCKRSRGVYSVSPPFGAAALIETTWTSVTLSWRPSKSDREVRLSTLNVQLPFGTSCSLLIEEGTQAFAQDFRDVEGERCNANAFPVAGILTVNIAVLKPIYRESRSCCVNTNILWPCCKATLTQLNV